MKNKKIKTNSKQMEAKKKNQKHNKIDAQQVQMRFYQQATPMGPVAPNAPMYQGPTGVGRIGTARNCQHQLKIPQKRRLKIPQFRRPGI